MLVAVIPAGMLIDGGSCLTRQSWPVVAINRSRRFFRFVADRMSSELHRSHGRAGSVRSCSYLFGISFNPLSGRTRSRSATMRSRAQLATEDLFLRKTSARSCSHILDACARAKTIIRSSCNVAWIGFLRTTAALPNPQLPHRTQGIGYIGPTRRRDCLKIADNR